jgi:hypothetical protein
VARGKKGPASDKQALLLWALLAREGAAAFQSDLAPEPDKADRDALEKAGLIKCEARGRNRRIWIEVTEQGWDWAGRNLGAALPANSSAGSQILQQWLTRIQAFMDARKLALADILAPERAAEAQPTQPASQPASRPAPAVQPPCANGDFAATRKRIRKAYLDLTGGRFNTRALLSELRPKLEDIERATLDEALKRMQREEEASLYQLDNRIEITEADRAAAIYFGGEPRHILWIER